MRNNFEYLGSWLSSTKNDIWVRKSLAWQAFNKLTKIGKSNLPRSFKVRLLTATVESVLLYGCESWTLTKLLEKRLDGCYTRMLRAALNISWRSHTTNKVLYGNIPKVTDKIRKRRLGLVGHCYRHAEEVASQLILWAPQHGNRGKGRPALSFVKTLQRDTDLEVEELGTCMRDRGVWRAIVVRAMHSP